MEIGFLRKCWLPLGAGRRCRKDDYCEGEIRLHGFRADHWGLTLISPSGQRTIRSTLGLSGRQSIYEMAPRSGSRTIAQIAPPNPQNLGPTFAAPGLLSAIGTQGR